MLGFLKYWAKEFGPHPEGTGESQMVLEQEISLMHIICLLYTSDAADEERLV